MKKTIMSLITLIPLSMVSVPTVFAEHHDVLEQGKEIAFDRKKGNCLACHAIEDGNLAGELGPKLIDMKTRYPDKAALRSQIWDATKANPATSMPPFGRHRMLTEDEIDKVVEYIYSL